jgi:hypothetical protein
VTTLKFDGELGSFHLHSFADPMCGKYNAYVAGGGSHVHFTIWQGACSWPRVQVQNMAHPRQGKNFWLKLFHHLPVILMFITLDPNRLCMSLFSFSLLVQFSKAFQFFHKWMVREHIYCYCEDQT